MNDKRYFDGYRKGLSTSFDAIHRLFKCPVDGGYTKDELCYIFDIRRYGNQKKETIISEIIDQYDIHCIIARLKKYDETHACRGCIHKNVCKFKPVILKEEYNCQFFHSLGRITDAMIKED